MNIDCNMHCCLDDDTTYQSMAARNTAHTVQYTYMVFNMHYYVFIS